MDMLQEDQDTLERLKANTTSVSLYLRLLACQMLCWPCWSKLSTCARPFHFLELNCVQRWPRTQLRMFIVKVNPLPMLLHLQ